MANIDVEKFITSLIKVAPWELYTNIESALSEQNLEYKNGKIQEKERIAKFKVGDWIIDKEDDLLVGNVLDVRNGVYVCDTFTFPIEQEDNYRLWTLNDAKDGDVLVFSDTIERFEEKPMMGIFKQIDTYFNFVKFYAVCTHDKSTNALVYFCVEEDSWNVKYVRPSTEEEKKSFSNALKEKGYEFRQDKIVRIENDAYCRKNCKGYVDNYYKCIFDDECQEKKIYDKNTELLKEMENIIEELKKKIQKL